MSFTLRELDGHFLGRLEPDGSCYRVETLDEAQGVMFQCPKCAVGAERAENDRFINVHSVICWFKHRGVPDELEPNGRWNPSGSSIDDLTFVGPGSHSVLLTSGCGWHGFVSEGRLV